MDRNQRVKLFKTSRVVLATDHSHREKSIFGFSLDRFEWAHNFVVLLVAGKGISLLV